MGPGPTNCRQGIRTSLLRDTGDSVQFRQRFVVSLSPEEGRPVLEFCRELLDRAGLRDLEELRKLEGLPHGRLICREVVGAVKTQPQGNPLLHAAILGLCNAAFYSFDRPVVWTESRLKRQVELFAVEDFYED